VPFFRHCDDSRSSFFAIGSAIREAFPARGTPIEYRRSANKYSQETTEEFPSRPGRLKFLTNAETGNSPTTLSLAS